MERAPAGAVYNVGGGREASLRDAIEALERLAGRRVDARDEPDAAGDVRRTAADTRLIRAELGWAPATSLDQGLAARLARGGGTVARQ